MISIMNRIYKILIKSIFKISLLFIFAILFFNAPLNAGNYIKIDRLDADSEFPKIKIFLTVKDSGKSNFAGLTEENIFVYEDGYRANFEKVKGVSESDSTLYLVVNIDSSKSLSAKLLTEVKKSAREFVNLTNSGDMIALYRFNDDATLLSNFTKNLSEIQKKIDTIERHGTRTLLYNALYDSIDLLNKTNAQRKAVIVFTDGKDEGSSIEADDVIKFAKESRTSIYCISFNPRDKIKILSRISLLTGGKQFNTKKKDIESIHRNILNSNIPVNKQYLIEYKSALLQDGKTHSIEVNLKHNGFRDKDQINVTFKKAEVCDLPIISEKILIAIVISLILLLIIIVLCFFWNVNKAIKSSQSHISEVKTSDKETKINGDSAPKDEDEEKTEERISTKAWLVERDGTDAGKKITLEYAETTIGRDTENRIIVEDKSVSKKHAKIKVIKNSFYLFDMASDKGTFLNESKLLRPKLLYDWDEIKIGKKVYIFRISNVA